MERPRPMQHHEQSEARRTALDIRLAQQPEAAHAAAIDATLMASVDQRRVLDAPARLKPDDQELPSGGSCSCLSRPLRDHTFVNVAGATAAPPRKPIRRRRRGPRG